MTTPEDWVCPESMQGDTFAQGLRRRLYNRFTILRSSPFRLGLIFWLLFTSCLGSGLFIFYQTLQDQLLNKVDATITERFDRVREVYENEGLEELKRVAEVKSKSAMASSLGFYLASGDGTRVAGNIPEMVSQTGWNLLAGDEIGLDDDDSLYRFYTTNVGDYTFSIGRSVDNLVLLRQVALVCSSWMLAISTILSLGVALLVAHRVKRRMFAISSAMNSVAAGNLLTRIPVTSAGDDIDIVSEKINTSLDRLKLTVDGMRQVSTDIAHDLKTPLNRLFITIEEAASKSRAGGCVGDDLESALDEANAINGTFEALLRIAQIEAGARKAQFKPVDLKEVLETAAEVYGAVVEENGQTLITYIQSGNDGNTLPVFGDRGLLMQLVVNLIENSVNHASAGSEIVLSGAQDSDGVYFTLSDSGPGIPEHEREKVFQRLYRLDRSRTNKGTGLGLSMVKAVTELHSGTITLSDNAPGLITTVRFG